MLELLLWKYQIESVSTYRYNLYYYSEWLYETSWIDLSVLVSPPSCMNDWQMQFYVWTLMMQLNNETQEYAYLLVRYQEMKESWYLIYYIGIRDTLCGLSIWWKSGAHTISRDERRLIYAGLSIGMIITIFILFNLLSPLNNTNISPTTKLLPTSPFSSPQNCQNK